MTDMKEFDLGNGWKLVPITSPGHEGWCNLMKVDHTVGGHIVLLPPEIVNMVRKLTDDKYLEGG